MSRKQYLRVLALASLDILLTLPFGLVNIVLSTIVGLHQDRLPFYAGWEKVHDDWRPQTYTWEDLKASGKPTLSQDYFNLWTSPILAWAIFALFGLTAEARASYPRFMLVIRGWLGASLPMHNRHSRSTLDTIKFEGQSHESVLEIKKG